MPNQKNTKPAKFNSAARPNFKDLKRTLERDFFAEAIVTSEKIDEKCVDLVIHLNCNFGLTESLFHLNNGNWGNFQNSIAGEVKISPFQASLIQLESEYNISVDIKELSLHLRDTSIIIGRLPNLQIQDHLESILEAVSENFVHFTKGLSQMPYEIFAPLYEESQDSLRNSDKNSQNKSNYLDFWGLYFEGEDDTAVYDVKSKTIIEQSDFFLLNQWG